MTNSERAERAIQFDILANRLLVDLADKILAAARCCDFEVLANHMEAYDKLRALKE